jgi:hypothetical protein
MNTPALARSTQVAGELSDYHPGEMYSGINSWHSVAALSQGAGKTLIDRGKPAAKQQLRWRHFRLAPL